MSPPPLRESDPRTLTESAANEGSIDARPKSKVKSGQRYSRPSSEAGRLRRVAAAGVRAEHRSVSLKGTSSSLKSLPPRPPRSPGGGLGPKEGWQAQKASGADAQVAKDCSIAPLPAPEGEGAREASAGGRRHGVPGGRRGLASPHVRFSMCLKRVRGEDSVFVREGGALRRDGPAWSLFCLCDGHNGTQAAQYIKANLWNVLARRLPLWRLPEGYDRDFRRFSMKVCAAVAEAFVKIGEQFTAHCASNDVASGLRLLVGSTGLWRVIDWNRAAEVIRKTNIKAAAALAINAAAQHNGRGWQRDTTALVVDIDGHMPDTDNGGAKPGEGELSACCKGLAARLCGCPESDVAEDWNAEKNGLLVVARLDGWDLVKPAAGQQDPRTSCLKGSRSSRDGPAAIKGAAAGTPREWAPAFLTAQRAALGHSSSGSAWAPVRVPRKSGMSACFG
eukprot:evm.model.scf_539.2 EVM.evm.TU.scf_539.2   scf_539:7757-12895(-)